MMSYFRAHRFDKEAVNDTFGQVAAAIQELDARNSPTSIADNTTALASIQRQITSIQADIAALRIGGIAAHGGTHNASSTDPANIEEGQVNGLVVDLMAKENAANKDATGGYTGLTLFKINFKNALNTFTSFFTNSNTAARTYTFQDRNGTIADDTDLALKAPLASPTLTGTPAAPTGPDNDATTQIATDAFVKGQIIIDTGAHGNSQAVNMTAATSGSNGIAVADNANLAFGTTTNVTLIWRGSLPIWGNVGTPLFLIHKRQDVNNRWGLYVNDISRALIFYLFGTGGASIVATSTIAVPLPNNTFGEVSASVIRETALMAGSVTFCWNGIQLGSVVTIPAGTPPSMTNTGTLYVLGTENAGRTAGAVQSAYIYNRALPVFDVLDKVRNGVNISDKWGNMTGPVSGCVMALEPEGINATNWMGSANGMNATYPAAGGSLVRYASSDIAAAMHASRIWFLN